MFYPSIKTYLKSISQSRDILWLQVVKNRITKYLQRCVAETNVIVMPPVRRSSVFVIQGILEMESYVTVC